MATISVPTVGGIQKGLTNYAYGVVAGLAYKTLSGVTGSGLIGGALASAGASSIIKGPAGEAISAMAGFAAGQSMNNPLSGILGGMGGSDKTDSGDQFDDQI